MPAEKAESGPRRSRAVDECADDTPAITVRVGHPRIRPHVVPMSSTAGLAKEDLITSFIRREGISSSFPSSSHASS